jgi:hypothetical protein
MEEAFFGDVGGDTCELLPRRAWHVGHSLTNREMSSFGTLGGNESVLVLH